MKTFKTRAISSIVFVAIMIVGLFGNPWLFLLLLLIIHAGCWVEYQSLIAAIDSTYRQISIFHKIGIITAGIAFMLWCTHDYYRVGTLNIHAIGWWLLLLMIFVFPIIEILFAKQFSLIHVRYSILGLLYISISLGCMLLLRNMSWQKQASLAYWSDVHFPISTYLVFCVWVNDTMAYIIGSLIGKTPLSSISPKKTWEGTISGILICVVVMTSVSYLLHWLFYTQALTISLIAAVAGNLGDLLESKLKRMANVKDSGNIMPGHGGFLDRFDSLLVAAPLVWIYVTFF